MPHITSNPRDDTYIPSTRGSWSTGMPKGSMSGYTRDSLHMVLPSNSAENNYYITSKSLLQVAPVHRHINASMATLKLHSVTSHIRNSKELHRKQNIGPPQIFQLIYHYFIFYIISFDLLIYVVVLIITYLCTIVPF